MNLIYSAVGRTPYYVIICMFIAFRLVARSNIYDMLLIIVMKYGIPAIGRPFGSYCAVCMGLYQANKTPFLRVYRFFIYPYFYHSFFNHLCCEV